MEIFLFVLVAAVVFVIWYGQTPAGKEAAAKAEKERQAAAVKFAQEKEKYRIENILEPLINNPDNSSYCNSIPTLLIQGSTYHSYNYGTIYNDVLEILASNPDKIHLKPLCLEIGRKHYSALRPDKRPTIYDEQAIQNDILVRSK